MLTIVAESVMLSCASDTERQQPGVTALSDAVVAGLSIVLAFAGIAKLRHPDTARAALRAAGVPRPCAAVRLGATSELAAAALGLTLAPMAAGVVLAAMFGALAVVAGIAARRAPELPCGCFGDDDGPPLHRRHVAVNAGCAVAALFAGSFASSSATHLARANAASALLTVAAGVLLAMSLRTLLQGRRPTNGGAIRLVDGSARVLEARFPRRTALQRVALAGSALAIAPLRYLLYPVSALAIVAPGDCASGLCTDGYTAFCCEINNGANSCPTGTFPGGWWMCTDYRGNQLCADVGVRYYIDCNALPGAQYPGGCRCAQGTCADRRIACNIFRYGNATRRSPVRLPSCAGWCPASTPARSRRSTAAAQHRSITTCARMRRRACSHRRCSWAEQAVLRMAARRKATRC